MREGSGLVRYAREFPNRYFDVGASDMPLRADELRSAGLMQFHAVNLRVLSGRRSAHESALSAHGQPRGHCPVIAMA